MAVVRHELLGSGSLGENYRATKADGLCVTRPYAVKVIRPSLVGDVIMLHRLASAAQHAAALEGPGFATVHDLYVAEGQVHVLMDLVDGVDLERLVEVVRARGETLPPVAALSVLADVAAALAAMHQRADLVWQGVCQLGLWPAKILIRSDGRVVLPAPGLLMSQPPEFWRELAPEQRWFVAPEVVEGHVAPAADAWSLGRLWSWLVGEATEALWPELVPVAKRLVNTEPSRRGDLEHASAQLSQLLASFGRQGKAALGRYVRRYRASDTDLYLPDPDDVAAAAENIDLGPTQPFTRAEDSQPNRM
jgi:hypothetical protein